jgi:hypothetical protein
MVDKLELKLEILFTLDCPDNQKEKVKEKLDDFGWFILQEIKLDKIIKSFPGTIETAYDVKVIDLEN